ncbi:lysozyme [Qipengyuania nanhaisediminis]|uniref:lysozyme n=1 Tax=Qipengyuania nanhaisediminis TaxID=604088 RepID=UPI0038B370A7
MTQPSPASAARPFARKPLFDLVRRMLGRGFSQAEVDAMDEVLDDAIETGIDAGIVKAGVLPEPGRPSVPRIKRTTAQGRAPRAVGARGTALIKRFEGCARLRSDGLVEAYPDPATGGEPWTIGWGATGPDRETGGRIGPDSVWTQAQCDARLECDLERYASEVACAIGNVPTTQAQFDALVSFHYNTGAIARATLTRKHKAGDHAGAAAEFARWNRAGGRVLKGLVRRRAEEAKLYLSNPG